MLLFASSCGFIIIPKDTRVFCCCFVFLFVFSLEGLGFCLFGVLVFWFPANLPRRKESLLVCECTETPGCFCLYCDPYLVENQGQCQCWSWPYRVRAHEFSELQDPNNLWFSDQLYHRLECTTLGWGNPDVDLCEIKHRGLLTLCCLRFFSWGVNFLHANPSPALAPFPSH